MQDSPAPLFACLNIAWSVAFGDCYPNGEVAVVVGAAIAECGVIAEVHEECRNWENVAGMVGPEMEATYFAEEMHTDSHLAGDSQSQVLDLETSPFDLVLSNLEGFPSSVSGQGDFAGAEVASIPEQSSCAEVFAETWLTAERYSVTCAGTAMLVLMEVHHWFQRVEGRYLTEVLHEVASSGDLNIRCFGLSVS